MWRVRARAAGGGAVVQWGTHPLGAALRRSRQPPVCPRWKQASAAHKQGIRPFMFYLFAFYLHTIAGEILPSFTEADELFVTLIRDKATIGLTHNGAILNFKRVTTLYKLVFEAGFA